MVAAEGDGIRAVPIDEVAGNLKSVPADHSWVEAARRVGTSMGGVTGKREIIRKTA